MSTALGAKPGYVPREEHTYLRRVQGKLDVCAFVRPGWPHGDAWGAVLHPSDPPTHDTERHRLARMTEKSRKR